MAGGGILISIPAPLAEAIELDRFSKLYFTARGDDYIVSSVEYEGMKPCRVVVRGKRYYLDLPEKRKKWVVLEVWSNNFLLLYTDKPLEMRLQNRIDILRSTVELARRTYESTGKKMYLAILERCESELRKLEKLEEACHEGK